MSALPRCARRCARLRRAQIYTPLALVLALILWPPLGAAAQPAPPDQRAIKKALQIDLEGSLRQAQGLLAEIDRGVVPPAAVSNLTSRFDQVRADALLIRDGLPHAGERLQSHSVSATILDRQARMSAAIGDAMDRIQREMDEVVNSADPAAGAVDRSRLRAALDVLVRDLAQHVTTPDRTPLGVSLPHRTLDLAQAEPQRGTSLVPAYADIRTPGPSPADLAESPDAPLTPEISNQARTLRQNAIEIFEFVQNQIEMEFYHGAMKGAVGTLREKRGNDLDQASLLVALMRASGIPARYVRGIIALSDKQVLAWSGVSSTRRAAELLTRAGIPFQTTRQGGSIGSFEIEHAWVEISIAYNNYRGAPLGGGGRVWIPLDPSIKSSVFTPGIDLLAAMDFTADRLLTEYLSGLQTLSPPDFYKKQITDYLEQNRPDLTYEQALSTHAVQPASLGLLPNTLPYATTYISYEGPAVPEPLRHRVRFRADGEGGTSLDVTLPASELLGQRLTLSYVPATVEDQIAVSAFLGLDNTPAYLVKVRPVITVGGVVRGAGEFPVQMGALHEVTIDIQTPRGSVPITNSLVAGGYYAIGLGSQKVTYQQPADRAPDDTEPAAADLLYKVASDYLDGWNQAERALADTLRVLVVRPMLAEVMVGNVYNRTLLFGEPQAIEFRGVFVDADLRIAEPVPAGADDSVRREFMRLSGLAGSMLESDVLETDLEVEAVSAAKLLQLARVGGISIDTIDASNIATGLPLLQTADVVKADIEAAVNQGWQAIVPRTDFTHKSWTGIGYVLFDPDTFAAGYFISGGLAGSENVVDPRDWVQAVLRHPYHDPPNHDPAAAAVIQKVPTTDKQNGTVGERLPQPIVVWVTDADGRPVHGAVVTFTIQAGGGNFVGGRNPVTLTVLTDYVGLAKAYPTLGQKTSDVPFYVKAAPDDTYATRVGQNVVTASVGVVAPIFLDIPFQLFAYPADPHHIVRVLGEGNSALAGTAAGSIKARVEDRYDNPLSNVMVDFNVLQASSEWGLLPPTAQNLVIYEAPCSSGNRTPLLGDCNAVRAWAVKTSLFGATVETILGDTVGTMFQVRAEVFGNTAIAPVVFSLFSLGSRNFGQNRYAAPVVGMAALELVNDRGELLNATRVATLFPRPLEVALFVVEDNYAVEPVGGGNCDPSHSICYKLTSLETSRTRPIDIHRAEPLPFAGRPNEVIITDTSPQTATVTFTPTAGGGTTNPPVLESPAQNSGHGRYATRLTVGSQPALNTVEIDASTQVLVPCFDLHDGTVKPKLADLRPGQGVWNSTSCAADGQTPETYPGATSYQLAQNVYGVLARVVQRKNLLIGETGGTIKEYTLDYTIEPADYRARTADVDIFKIDPALLDSWIGLFVGSHTAGQGSVRIFQGTGFDTTKPHKMQLTINRGSEAEIRSDLEDLKISFICDAPSVAGDIALHDTVNTLRWSMDTSVTPRAGYILENVGLGERSMARMMSVPYVNLQLTPAWSGLTDTWRVNLMPDDDGNAEPVSSRPPKPYRSRLVDFSSNDEADTFSMEATYTIGKIPDWFFVLPDEGVIGDACVMVTERYEFDKVVEPAHIEDKVCGDPLRGLQSCGNFRPIVEYAVVESSGVQSTELLFDSITIPQRLHLTADDHITNDPELMHLLGRSSPNVNAVSVYHDCEFTEVSCVRFDQGGTIVSIVVPLESNPLAHEAWRTVILDGHANTDPVHAWDNIHQTYRQSVFEPGANPEPHGGCPECVHIHWRWAHVADSIYGGAGPGGSQGLFGGGAPLIPSGSRQDVDIAVVAYSPSEVDWQGEFSQLPNDHQSLVDQSLVFWYAGTGHQRKDSFFNHGGFFSERLPGDINGDGRIDTHDWDALIQASGSGYTLDMAYADLNGDGLICAAGINPCPPGADDGEVLDRLIALWAIRHPN